MDQSVDSIGSCSLDVDAESSDISETSSCFPTPTVQKDFTINIQNRCSDKNFDSLVSTQPKCRVPESNNIVVTTIVETNQDKVPSYLNLACCVNGYSNLTTYNSKIRQDINKSREVSPIRPSANCIQYCKKNNSLAPPVLLKMSDVNSTSITCNTKKTNSNNTFNDSNDHNANQCNGKEQDKKRNISFIQQRVERLYGPAALTQGLYSPKKGRSSHEENSSEKNKTEIKTPELIQKFRRLSPCKEFKNKITTPSINAPEPTTVDNNNSQNNNIVLPVFRHLSKEFRAQLPAVSPKKHNLINDDSIKQKDEVDHQCNKNTTELSAREELPSHLNEIENSVEAKHDGHYFLNILKNEQKRLLSLADDAEKHIADLKDNSETSEDTLGILRTASGKARLLVSQKMKQFEGLCHNNINNTSTNKYYTTVDDLQGFWDMVTLQVDHINSIFDDIQRLKNNNWKNNETNVEASSNKQKPIKTVSNKAKAIPSTNGGKLNATTSAAALKREAQRKQLLELKRKQKLAIAAANNLNNVVTEETTPPVCASSIEIFVKNSNGR